MVPSIKQIVCTFTREGGEISLNFGSTIRNTGTSC